jgi:hypothetical protein
MGATVAIAKKSGGHDYAPCKSLDCDERVPLIWFDFRIQALFALALTFMPIPIAVQYCDQFSQSMLTIN